MSRDRVLTAIDALYDSVLDDEGFGPALDLICGATSSDGFNIFLLDRQSGSVPLNMSRGISDDVLRDYNAHYVMIDPGIQFFLNNPGLPFYYNALHTTESEIDRSEYYSWLQGAGGARYYLAQTLEIDRRVSMIATAQRGRRVGHAQPADIDRLARIGPHIQRTMRLNLLIGDLNSRLAAAYDALDSLDHGICLLSSGGRIVFANRAARDFSQSTDVVWLGRERGCPAPC